MKWDHDKGNRSRVKGKARQISGEFGVDEIHVGTREELIGRLQMKYGYSKEKAEAWPIFLVMAGGRVRNKEMHPKRSRAEKRCSA